ncbi:amino acid ABC transporter permease [Microvirga lotononidis]|uniref:Amine acid ABC transporter, permease protein, 3-TM region, His/Glu/Gln/Arg/opine family n=1 Tax=Microvirga lotononidis TaxID=864069 RepID=I4Z132_9HYPH|nr:amino acid ABC transporter permease [Microvirga lotononidis]EIM29924.1 amine acid ABC transporter, permease protein, 3-TM region, His/Glu/Gln/Arg/opine family [Microvirga lotononidis]WQO32014.1 amino acid ABC transporter permease [Microvirga lotononidis]
MSAVHFTVLLQGLVWTVVLSAVGFLGGGIVGFVIALARISANPLIHGISSAYVTLLQGTPLLIQMFVLYFGLPIVGLEVPPLAAASIAMTLFSSAYLGEIWRGCLQSVPKAQWEAAECLALSRVERLLLVILPQALRIATPPTVGFMVQIIKNTSIASVIGMVEMTYIGKMINNTTFKPFQTYVVIAGLYFLLCYPLSWLSRRLERNLNVAHR